MEQHETLMSRRTITKKSSLSSRFLKRRIKLSDHFTYTRLFRFVIPTILMMLFTSMYGVVDGLYVNNYVGKEAFAAVTLITPFPLLVGAFAYLIGGGGSAVISRAIAAGKQDEANRSFTFLTIGSVVGAVILAIAGILCLPFVARLMGADADAMPYCLTYGRILLACIPLYVLQNVFQSFLTAAGHPKVGLLINLVSAASNLVLDFVFVGVLKQGVVGAALATAVSQMIGGIVPFIAVHISHNLGLRFVHPHFMPDVLKEVLANGVSEFISEIFHPLASVMYNYKLSQLVGLNGVAAYGVLMNVGFLFGAVFLGFAVGCAPLFSYNYECKNFGELRNLFRKSATSVVLMGFLLYGIALCIEGPFAKIFFGHDEALLTMTEEGFALHSLSYMVMGLAVFTSAFFTALQNSRISFIISFMRTLLFEVLAILILPFFFDINGVWAASLTAELLALVFTIGFLLKYRKKYHYGSKRL